MRLLYRKQSSCVTVSWCADARLGRSSSRNSYSDHLVARRALDLAKPRVVVNGRPRLLAGKVHVVAGHPAAKLGVLHPRRPARHGCSVQRPLYHVFAARANDTSSICWGSCGTCPF